MKTYLNILKKEFYRPIIEQYKEWGAASKYIAEQQIIPVNKIKLAHECFYKDIKESNGLNVILKAFIEQVTVY